MSVLALAAGFSSAADAPRLRLGDLELGFTVELGELGTNAVTSFDERAMSSFRTESDGDRHVGIWRGHAVCGADFEVRAEVVRDDDGAWRYAYSYSGNASRKFLRRVKFPEVTAPNDPDADVFVPFSIGRLVHCDWASVPAGTRLFGSVNGGYRALRFAALLNRSGARPSVYLDWRTDGYDSSHVHCFKDRGGFARLAVFYDLPFTAAMRLRSERPFVGVIREYRGSWWEAAHAYRKWAVTRPGYAAMKARAAERGRLRDVSMWFWNRGAAEHVTAPVERFARDAGVPVALDWYWWHRIPYDTQYPNFWPPREGVEKFRATIGRMKRLGIYTQVYVNGVSRGEDDPDWANGGADESWWWWPAAHPERTPRRVVYNRYSDVGLVEMCGEAPVFQRKVREVVRHLVKDGGLDAVYLDQIGCACHSPCFNPRHRHAPGDADAPTQGYVDFVSRIRAENPGVQFSTEDVADAYMDQFDSHIVLCVSSERFGGWNDAVKNESVPAFAAVYNDVAVLFGGYTMMDGVPPYDVNWPQEKKWKKELDWPMLFPDQFAIELARSAVFGLQPCVHNFKIENVGDPRLKDDYAFMVATAQCRHENAKFLSAALLANPGTLMSAKRTAKFCNRGTYNPEGEYRTVVREGLPAVFHSVWKGSDGEVRVLLVNWTREAQDYRLVSPDMTCEGSLPPRTWKTVVRAAPAHRSRTFRLALINPDCSNDGIGQCVVMTTPSGKTYLYDTNTGANRGTLDAARQVKNDGRDIVIPWLQAHGIREIEGLIISHYHADHFGGFLWMLDHFPIKRVWNNGFMPAKVRQIPETALCDEALARWERKHPGKLVRQTDETTDLGWDEPGVKFEVVWPRKGVRCDPIRGGINDCLHHLLNAESTALAVTVGTNRLLIVGDINAPYLEKYMAPALKTKGAWGADVVVLPAHGDFRCAPQILEMKPRPRIVLGSMGNVDWMSSAGRDNRRIYGEKGFESFTTNVDGDLVLTVEGGSLSLTADPSKVYPHQTLDDVARNNRPLPPEE